MPQLSCRFCGQTYSAITAVVREPEQTFCNVGCALRARVPVDADGNFPVNRHLVGVLIAGFLFFNQGLTAGVVVILIRRGQHDLAESFAWISMALALLFWASLLALQLGEKVSRGKDHVFSAATLVIILTAILKPERQIGLTLAATAVLLIWNLRGLVYKQRVVKAVG